MGAVRPVLKPLSSPTINSYIYARAAMCRYMNTFGRHILLPYSAVINFTGT